MSICQADSVLVSELTRHRHTGNEYWTQRGDRNGCSGEPVGQYDPGLQVGVHELDLVYLLYMVLEGSPALPLLEAHVRPLISLQVSHILMDQ